jgi:hypothetical protein
MRRPALPRVGAPSIENIEAHGRFVTRWRMRTRGLVRFAVAGALVLCTAVMTLAQRGGGGVYGPRYVTRVPYNGQFTFTRLSYGGGGFGRGSSSWNHDYPQADMHLPMILEALTAFQPNLNVSNIFDLEDPEIYKNPVLYMWEPGFWRVTQDGARNLRNYMLKGGFVVFDDFEEEHWYNFEHQFRQALPEAVFVKLDTSHPLFHSFFDMNTIKLPHPSMGWVEPAFYGVFENNDPDGRMMALVCYNSDVAEYWEWSAEGIFPVDTTNDAYKLGINYMVYALMH